MKSFIFLFILLTGCAAFPTYYYQRVDKKYVYPATDENKRQEVSFSVDCSFPDALPDVGAKKARLDIKERLTKTGLFKKVRYSFEYEKAPLHFHFMCNKGGTDDSLVFAYFVPSAYGAIPVGFENTFDVSMTAYWNNKEVYSITAPASRTIVSWLPFILLSPSLRSTRKNVYKYALDYVVSKIATEKLYAPATFETEEKVLSSPDSSSLRKSKPSVTQSTRRRK